MIGAQSHDHGAGEGAAVPAPPVPVLSAPWSVRIPDGDDDVALIHHWMHQPYVVQFWQQAWPVQRWREEIVNQLTGDHSLPLIVADNGADAAYLEVYRVGRDRLAGYYPHQPHDLGLHIAIGEPARIGKGLGRRLLADLISGLFDADPECVRIVAEPDSSNVASLTAFRAAGFAPSGEITLPDKTALLMISTRQEDKRLR